MQIDVRKFSHNSLHHFIFVLTGVSFYMEYCYKNHSVILLTVLKYGEENLDGTDPILTKNQ